MVLSEWDKLKKRLIDLVKSSDDTPTEYQRRLYDLTVGALIGEGNKLQNLNHRLAQSTIVYEQRAMIANRKLEKIRTLGLVSLIADMREDLMGFYRRWQKNRDFEGYHKTVRTSDMRAVRKYMQDFEAIEEKLKEIEA